MSGKPIRAAVVMSQVLEPAALRQALVHLWEAIEEDDYLSEEERSQLQGHVLVLQGYVDRLIEWRE